MVVCHQRELYTVRGELRPSFYEDIGRIKHDHSYRNPLVFLGPVVYPTFLALALCPPLLWPYLRLHGQGISGPGDLPFLPLLYLRFVLIRLAIWKNALSLGVAAV